MHTYADEFLALWHRAGAIPGLAEATVDRYGSLIINEMDGASPDRLMWYERGRFAPDAAIWEFLSGCAGLRVLVGPYRMSRGIDPRHLVKRGRVAITSAHGVHIGYIVFGPSLICGMGAAMLDLPEKHSALQALILDRDPMNVPAAISILWMLSAAADLPGSALVPKISTPWLPYAYSGYGQSAFSPFLTSQLAYSRF